MPRGVSARRSIHSSSANICWRRAAFSDQNWSTYAELGWLALGLPEDVGGLACSFVETAIVMQELGRVLALEPYTTSAVLCAHIVDASGSQTHRSELLPELAAGNLRLALAHSEADSRYELNAVRATAARATNDGYVLNGAQDAGVRCALRAPTHRLCGDGARLRPVHRAEECGGCDAEPVSADRWDACCRYRIQVRARAAVGAARRAAACARILEEAVDRTVLAQVAEALGAMEAVLEITNAYLKQRVQFGQPIGKFQALQHRMAEMFVEVQETRSILYRGMAMLEAPPAERKRAISAAKVVAANAGKFVGAQGIQLHGGIGMTEEYAVGHYYKKLIAFEKRFGDTEYHVSRYLQHEPR